MCVCVCVCVYNQTSIQRNILTIKQSKLKLSICVSRVASNEIFSPSNKILLHGEISRAKNLSATL